MRQQVLTARSAALQESLRAPRRRSPPAQGPRNVPAAGFADTLTNALQQVNSVQQRSSDMQVAYERGQVTDIAEVMLARQEAGVAFEGDAAGAQQAAHRLPGHHADGGLIRWPKQAFPWPRRSLANRRAFLRTPEASWRTLLPEPVAGFIAQPALARALPALAGVGALAAAGMLWMTLASGPDRLLYSSLTDGERAKVVETLEAGGIGYRMR